MELFIANNAACNNLGSSRMVNRDELSFHAPCLGKALPISLSSAVEKLFIGLDMEFVVGAPG